MEVVVDPAMTAESVGSGGVEVLATPMVAALMERAAVKLIGDALPPSLTTVGSVVRLEHLAPTPVGTTVTTTASLVSVDGRRLRFSCTVTDPAGDVARGTHERVVVDRDRFLRSAAGRAR